MAKKKETGVAVVATSQNPALAVQLTGMTEEKIAQGLIEGYEATSLQVTNAVKGCVYYGSIVALVEFELGHRGVLKKAGSRYTSDVGMLGWIKANAPALVDHYKTIQRWKGIAQQQAGTLGMTTHDALLLLAGAEDKIDAKIPKAAIQRREEIYNAGSIRKLTQGLFDFGDGADAAKRGRPAGSKADLAKKPDTNDAFVAARAVWSKVIGPAAKCQVALTSAVKMLGLSDVEDALITLTALVDLLRERKEELRVEVTSVMQKDL